MSRSPAIARSTAGLMVLFVVLTTLEPCNVKTMTRPTVMPVTMAPSQ